jgi:phosphate transport system substrate-binding protein
MRLRDSVAPMVVVTAILLMIPALTSAAANSTTLRINGATSVAPVVAKAADKFRLRRPGVRVLVSPTGSGAGVQALGAGTADIAMVSREVETAEKKRFKSVNFFTVAIGRDAVVPVVSAAVYKGGVTALTLKDLRKIYSGTVTNWREFGGPDRTILVIDKEASRGTRIVFMEAVFGDGNARAAGAKLVTGSNNEEQSAVAQSDSAIGMLSNAWMNERVRGLAIKVGQRRIEPTLENIQAGIFPIMRNLNLVTNGQPKGLAKDFIDFVLSPEGQTVVEELEYVPIGATKRADL